jgi:hypothetical protein
MFYKFEMRKVPGILVFLVFPLLSANMHCFAQTDNREVVLTSQPPDLRYAVTVKDNRKIFHLGEIIELDETYSTSAPDKYLMLSFPQKVNGHNGKMVIEPSQAIIDRIQDPGDRSAFSILHINCASGVGGGVGGGTEDSAWPIKAAPIHFPRILTQQFQITQPGHYSIHATATNVVLAPRTENSAPITLASNVLEIEVVDDPQWSHATLITAMDRFDHARDRYVAQGWDGLAFDKINADDLDKQMNLGMEMQNAAETMSLLDTEESLTEIVRRYDGTPTGVDFYRHVFLSGIVRSRHGSMAISLLSQRMLDPDFSASERFIDQLTAMTLQDQFPRAFADKSAVSKQGLFPEAREVLREYVLALGKALQNKTVTALEPSMKTFRYYAGRSFCNSQALISENLAQQIIQQTGTDY